MDRVQEYYAHLGEREWTRLETPSGSLEFKVNRHFIGQYLKSGDRVLDIGGGPGRYTLWLAERGHRVVLGDISTELLAVAEEKVASSPFGSNIEEIRHADARDLSAWQDGEFDAALSLGPFYHLMESTDRARAASELHRVVRSGGMIFVAFMPRYAFLRRTAAVPEESRHLLDPEFVHDLMERGVFLNDRHGRFDGGYGVAPDDIVPFFGDHGFDSVELISSEGIGTGIEESVLRLADEDPEAHECLMEIIFDHASDPTLRGLTTHLLYIGIRR